MPNIFTTAIVRKFGTPSPLDPNFYTLPHPLFHLYADLSDKKILLCDGSNLVHSQSLNLLDLLDFLGQNLTHA